MKSKNIIIYAAFALLLFSIPLLYDSIDPAWQGLIKNIYIGLLVILAGWMIFKDYKWTQERAENDPLLAGNFYFKKGKFNWIKITSFILTISILLLLIVNIKYKIITTGFFAEQIKKEIIIKKYDSSGQFLEQITYDDQGIGFPTLLIIAIGVIYTIILTYKQEKIDDERIKMVRLKAFRESFVFALLLGWVLLLYNSFSYVQSVFWFAYFIIILVAFRFRSKYWAEKI